MENIKYLCVIILILIISYKYLDGVRNSPKPIFSLQSIITDYTKRVGNNVQILKNITTPKKRKILSDHILVIQNVIKDPSYFSKPCITILNVNNNVLTHDQDEIKKILEPLRKFRTPNRYVKNILKEMATDYEALINLSRNSFCVNI